MNNKANKDIPACWGASSRDVERNGSRNSQHVEFLLHETEGVSNTPFIYQYCGHESKSTSKNSAGQCVTPESERTAADKEYACRHITAIIVPFPGGTFDTTAANRALTIGAALGVPVYFVYHTPFDTEYNHTIDYEVTKPNGKKTYVADAMWREDFLDALLVEQEKHTEEDHACYIPEDVLWLDNKNDEELDEESTTKGKGDDLTVSGIIRVIPGVRHLDMDACITCDKCNLFIALVEASSDGYSRGKYSDQKKTAAMTLKIGAKLGIPTLKLLHDKDSDVTDESGADITTWKPGKLWDKDGVEFKDGDRPVDMLDALDVLGDMVAVHNEARHS